MEYKSTLQSALFELEEVRDLLSRFIEKKDLPQIEIDLALSKMRNIYELLIIIEKSKHSKLAETGISGSTKKEEQTVSAGEVETPVKTSKQARILEKVPSKAGSSAAKVKEARVQETESENAPVYPAKKPEI